MKAASPAGREIIDVIISWPAAVAAWRASEAAHLEAW